VSWRALHIRIDTFIERTSPAARRVALVLGTLVSIGAIMTIVVSSFRVVLLLYELDQRSDALRAPAWITQSFIPLALGIIALIMGVKVLMMLTETRRAGSGDGG
jgi:TRAP-type C4-dicarboxylate transport system permease small subunit